MDPLDKAYAELKAAIENAITAKRTKKRGKRQPIPVPNIHKMESRGIPGQWQ